MKSELPGVWKSNGSKTDINNTDSSETDLIYSAQSGENISGEMQEDERYRFYFQDKLEIPILEKNFPHDREILMEILELLVETVTSRKKFLRICGEEKPKEVVKSRLMKLDSMHIQYVMEYLPVNTIVELDDREFRVDSVNFEQGTVSLQDMTLAKKARYPIFRTEPLEYIRHLYEQADVPMKEAIETTVFTALHNAGVAYEDFSPEQMDVIYSVAESGGELEELLNPDFSPEQMQLIADVQTRTDAIHRSAVDDVLNPLTSKPMTPEEVNHARRQHNLPLDSGAETEQPVQPKQEPMNFRITDDDLGAGGAKTKFKANIEAIRLLQTLDAEQRQATAEEQEVLSRYVGWGGIPQAFDEKNADWAKEYAELKSLLPADEYSEARASTLNAFYTSPTVIKAMY